MLIVLLLFSLLLGNPAQAKNPLQARMLAAFGNDGGDLLNMLYKMGLEVDSTFDRAGDTFAIRVCSNEPLRIALPVAAGAPFLTTIKLEKLGIPKSRIYYLRQNRNCTIPKNGYAFTEYWLVPKGAQFPEHAEARSAANLLGYQFTNWGQIEKGDRHEVDDDIEWLTPQSYTTTLDKVVALLKEHKNAIAVFVVPYYTRSTSRQFNKRLAEAESYIRRNGIASYRLHTKRFFGGPLSHTPEMQQYPNIFVVIEN
jgi:hypothetical protein